MTFLEELPQIIQGGMGIGVSTWRLAKSVSERGHLGIVSGTAIDSVLVRKLQLGDPSGEIRRAMSYFPSQEIVKRVMESYYIDGGKPKNEPFRLIPMPAINRPKLAIEVTILSNFVEVFLAKEGHNGKIGINYLEKIQLPTLPSLLGAMLAEVDYILMGAGIPLAIPSIIDKLCRWEPVELRLNVEDNITSQNFYYHFNPKEFFNADLPTLRRPKFLAIVSSDIIAKTLIKKSLGKVDGFIVEGHTAGGHNAPPRKTEKAQIGSLPRFTEKDIPNIEKIAELNLPFWLAGSYASHEKLKEALEFKAAGIQVGTAFAFCKESAIVPEIKERVIKKCLEDSLEVYTDFKASPTGYPFKIVRLENTLSDLEINKKRKRICDLGYLRRIYYKEGSGLGYRCPAEPVESFVKKGGTVEETEGKCCLCNGLMATIGLGQIRDYGKEPPIITSGEDFSAIRNIVKKKRSTDYTAEDVLNYLLGL